MWRCTFAGVNVTLALYVLAQRVWLEPFGERAVEALWCLLVPVSGGWFVRLRRTLLALHSAIYCLHTSGMTA